MDKVTREYIELYAPDQSSVNNGAKLSGGGSFLAHSKVADDTLYFAECAGSGKNNYRVSVDFMVANQPVFRCSCPSRKFPCKHGIGLLFEILAGGDFVVQEIPADILEKRNKVVARVEKVKIKKDVPEVDTVKKVNKGARLKKMGLQLEGLATAEKIVVQILEKGLGTIEGDSIATYQNLAKELGNYYLTGPQNYVYALIDEIEDLKVCSKKGLVADYSNAVGVLVKLNSIIKKSKVYLAGRVEAENVDDDDNELFEQLGGIWKLEDLKRIGLCKENALIVQLAFTIITSNASKQYVDIGFWLDLETGKLNSTYNYRPFKALKHIKQDDSIFSVIIPKNLVYYPGDVNQRIRWDDFQVRDCVTADFATIRAFGQDIASLIKACKGYLKNTLSQNYMPVLVACKGIGKTADGDILVEDALGSKIKLATMRGFESTLNNMLCLPSLAKCENQTIFGCIFYSEKERMFLLHPFSIVCSDDVIRLLY